MSDKSDQDAIREAVRDRYTQAAKAEPPGRCGSVGSPPDLDDFLAALRSRSVPASPERTAARLGYSAEDIASVPEGANLGLGCGNPQAIATLQLGEVVLDLGAGAGFDCFVARRRVGPAGRVIGVDMIPDMVEKARKNARAAGFENVEFRLGEIEHLPVADASVDVIISNCVINLSPDKPAVCAEAFRVLKPGGRLAVSDVVATAPLPASWRADKRLLSACISGAVDVDRLRLILEQAGFVDIDIRPKAESREFICHWQPGSNLENYVLSADIRARRP